MKKQYILPTIEITSLEGCELLVVLSGEPVDDVVAGARDNSLGNVVDDEEYEDFM
jgi:hypothetical protein